MNSEFLTNQSGTNIIHMLCCKNVQFNKNAIGQPDGRYLSKIEFTCTFKSSEIYKIVSQFAEKSQFHKLF